MAQVRQVVSETLQATVRRLLPSQRGFTEDLQASNVIMPIIDLTPSAEGSSLPVDLSRAIAFGSQTAFSAQNGTTVVVNNAGFYRIFGVSVVRAFQASGTGNSFTMSDGLSSKTVWEHFAPAVSDGATQSIQFDFIAFIDSGDSISAVSSNSEGYISGSSRQVADVSGNLVNPDGFSSS